MKRSPDTIEVAEHITALAPVNGFYAVGYREHFLASSSFVVIAPPRRNRLSAAPYHNNVEFGSPAGTRHPRATIRLCRLRRAGTVLSNVHSIRWTEPRS
jgi:hypothetical protein